MEKTKVLIVDDHELVRSGLKLLFQQYEYLEIVGEAQTLVETMALMEEYQPEVVIMDIRLRHNSSGIEGCAQISRCYPGTSVIILTSFSDDEMVLKSIKAGAKGFVKDLY